MPDDDTSEMPNPIAGTAGESGSPVARDDPPAVGHRVTVSAPSNIAFLKYWGAENLERALPVNPSFSMTLSECVSRSTVELKKPGEGDEVYLVSPQGQLAPAPEAFRGRILAHLDRLRAWGVERGLPPFAFRMATRNSFPAAAGLASSASGFAALTCATTRALGFDLPTEELSHLARRSGSGSASRSVLGGYVQWPTGEGEARAYAHQVFPADHWDLRDVIAVVEAGPKKVSSLEGHTRAPSSPHFESRLELVSSRLEVLRRAVAERDFATFAPVLEEEAIELHLIAMSSRPPIFYWRPATLEVLSLVREMRREGISAASTMDAGANVHVICPAEAEAEVARRLEGVPGVRRLIRDRVGTGPAVEEEHLLDEERLR